MSFIETITMSLRSMRANKSRTLLTVLGIVIGISSIIIVFSAGEGIRGLLVSQIESFGTNIIETEVKVPTGKKSETQGSMAAAMGVQVTSLTLEDLNDVNKLDNVSAGYASIGGQEKVAFGNESSKALLMGVNASYLDVDSGELMSGRFFTEEEDRSLSQIIVLGSKIKDKLFGDSDALGQSINLHHSKYQVIGVMKSKGSMMSMDFDNYIYIPIRTVQKKILNVNHISYMVQQLKNVDLADDTAEQIRLVLRENHEISNPDKDDFRVITMQEMMDTLNIITNALTILLLAIVAISLVVGGVGVLNVMYVIVSERTSEIGLRKAVGANYNDIMWQFLIESILITILGGIIGVILGIGASYLIAVGARLFGLAWVFVVPLKSLLVALFFSLMFGVIFGLRPAKKAARLSPIDALRKE